MAIFLELIKSKTSNQKYLALCTRFNSPTRFNVGYNLAVRCFAPWTEERISDLLSDVLKEWASGVLEKFDINPSKDLLASTSDLRSDVKCTLTMLLSLWWVLMSISPSTLGPHVCVSHVDWSSKEQECRRHDIFSQDQEDHWGRQQVRISTIGTKGGLFEAVWAVSKASQRTTTPMVLYGISTGVHADLLRRHSPSVLWSQPTCSSIR